MSLKARLQQRARALKADTYTLYLVCRDPRTPWLARLVAGAVVAYALSPIDLIPDPIPVLGYLDDLILVPAGLALALRLTPPEVLAECRARAQASLDRPGRNWRAGAVILALWLAAAGLLAVAALGMFT